jgi:large subunit ribosomal protein L32
MAVPKRKKSKSRVGMRKSANMAYAKKPQAITEDQTTGELKRPHHITPDGFYKGRNVFEKAQAEA